MKSEVLDALVGRQALDVMSGNLSVAVCDSASAHSWAIASYLFHRKNVAGDLEVLLNSSILQLLDHVAGSIVLRYVVARGSIVVPKIF